MKRFALLLVIILTLLAPQAFAAGWIKSVDEAAKKAKASNKMVFVDLFAEWCGWCHRFEQEVVPSEAFQKATDDMILMRLDIEDKGDGTRFAQRFNATQLPMFLIMTPEMDLAAVIKGYYPSAQFATLIGEGRKKHVEFLGRIKNEAKITDPAKKLELAKEFAARQMYSQSEPRFRKLAGDKAVPQVIRDSAYYELAVTQLMQKKYDDALKSVRALHAMSKSGEPVERAKLLAGQVYLDQGNLAAAAN
ncbi:MAG TPA: thioredoxin family protein, partial [Thermoanaerobaculia bacterium]